jgi:hypothetical protein
VLRERESFGIDSLDVSKGDDSGDPIFRFRITKFIFKRGLLCYILSNGLMPNNVNPFFRVVLAAQKSNILASARAGSLSLTRREWLAELVAWESLKR